MDFTTCKGTHDVILDEANSYKTIENLLAQVAEIYNFNEFRVPVIEYTDLFVRSVGSSSDIVRKEMYTFEDKGGRSVTLRPEFTAGIVRSMVNAKLYATSDLPVKAYYCGPTFRYERPQAGRYRQFNQFGLEALGVKSPYLDAEIISYGAVSLKFLGFKNIVLKINSLGGDESKENYKKAIKEYFAPFIDKMCFDCKERFELNPLRILDCKDPEDQKIIKNAPKMKDYLTEQDKKYFEEVLTALDNQEIYYEEDDTLVRGLDYYSDVVFEYHYFNKDGKSIGALGAGGHYDKLIGEIGGGDLHGVGLAFGIERLYSVLKDENLLRDDKHSVDLYVMPMSEEQMELAFDLTQFLRNNGFATEINYQPKSLKSQFKRAERANAKFAIIIGEEEANNNEAVVKNLETQEQTKVPFEHIIDALDHFLSDDETGCGCGCGHHHHGDDEDCCCCHGGECEDNDECCCGHHHEDSEELDDNEECCCCHHHKGN